MKQKTRKNVPTSLLYIFSFLASIGPLAAVFAFNFNDYVKTNMDMAKLGVGAILVVVFMVLKALDKLKMPRLVFFEAFCLLFSYLFAAILEDLMLISFAALIGEVIDYVAIKPMIKKNEKAKEREALADAVAERMESPTRKHIGGRV